MKLLLDEMLSPAIGRQLRERGHDAVAIKERAEWHGMTDADVMALARREHRAVVTNNLRDFRPLHHEAVMPGGLGHSGVVFVPGGYRRTVADTGRLIEALEALVKHCPGERGLADGEAWL